MFGQRTNDRLLLAAAAENIWWSMQFARQTSALVRGGPSRGANLAAFRSPCGVQERLPLLAFIR
jgi:hypothetical protein